MMQTSTPQGQTQENKNAVIKNGHSRIFLSGIPTAFNNQKGGDPRLQVSRITPLFNTPSPVPTGTSSPSRGEENDLSGSHLTYKCCKGFTLIELLIVVLIIGILAAVALPQYQITVAKSRVAAILPLIATIQKAEAAYYVENGKHTDTIQELDIDIPCTENLQKWTCGNDFLIQADNNKAVYASYCPNHNNSYEECADFRYIQLVYNYWNGTGKGSRVCKVMNESKLGENICKTLGQHTSGIYYRMN